VGLLKDLAHTLKGSAGTIGAAGVAAAAKALHASLCASAGAGEPDLHAAALITELTSLTEGLRSVLEAG
jgi:HPt (histidine-containing phosphotransfer) domain-containing protein